MNHVIELTADDAAQIAAFTRVAAPYDLLNTDSVRRSIFDDPDPQTVRAIFGAGLEAVGVAVVRGSHGFVKFLAVHPRARRRGLGRTLLAELESFCREHGATTVDIGTSAPYYVVPGVDLRLMEAMVLLNESGYVRVDEAVTLTVPLRDLLAPRLPVHTADESDLDAIRPWVERSFPQWINELQRGVGLGRCVVHADLGFACHGVNRDGWFGPIATNPDAGQRGIGTSTLLGALHAMRAEGHERAEIAWAVALDFYGKAVGARVGRVFWCYRKDL